MKAGTIARVLAATAGLGLLSGAQAPGRAAPTPVVLWGHIPAEDLTTLNGIKTQIDAALENYRYSTRQWQIYTLICPLLSRHALFKFVSRDSRDSLSEFVMPVPDDMQAIARDGLDVIPLRYSSVGRSESERDLHNVAIFNRFVADEKLSPKTDADWLQLAQVYLSMTGEAPRILTATDITAILSAKTAATLQLPLPQVRHLDGDRVRVSFSDFPSQDSPILSVTMVFESSGHLRSYDQAAVTTR